MRTIKYFTASWCGPCKVFKPVMEELSREGLSIEFIDVDSNNSILESHRVRAVPTCIIEENGVEVDRWTGVIQKQEVKRRFTAIH